MKESGTFVETLNIPQIIVLTPDTQVVVDLFKDLKASYEGAKTKIQVRVQKLFSKHITIEEHQQLLSTPPHKPGKFINIYIGVPNRIKRLIELGTIKVKSSNFKQLIFDTQLNTKNFCIFDILETRDDALDIILLSQKKLIKRKLQVYIA